MLHQVLKVAKLQNLSTTEKKIPLMLRRIDDVQQGTIKSEKHPAV
jgi:hypothetical protein